MRSINFHTLSVAIRRPNVFVTEKLHRSGIDVLGRSYSLQGCKTSRGVGDFFSRKAIQGSIKSSDVQNKQTHTIRSDKTESEGKQQDVRHTPVKLPF
jgi:hypothetical protein